MDPSHKEFGVHLSRKEFRVHPFFQKTFGGLTKAYYFRQLFFGAFFGAFMIWIAVRGPGDINIMMLVMGVVNTILYPYARLVYETIIAFIMGDNVFFVNAFFFMIVKVVMMLLVWSFAIFIAPIGLVFLYFWNGRAVND